jgi:hypothetical protein
MNCSRLCIKRRAIFCHRGIHTWGWVTAGHYFCNAWLVLWRQSVDIKRKHCFEKHLEMSRTAEGSGATWQYFVLLCFVWFCFFILFLREALSLFTHSLCMIFLSVLFLLRKNFSNVYRKMSCCVPLTPYIQSIQPLQVFCIVRNVLTLITGTYFKPRGSLSGTKL